MPRLVLCFLAATLLAGLAASAQAQGRFTTPKSDYDLFDPTPDDRLRDYSIDVAGAIRSPHTLDAGHFAVESELFGFTHTKISQASTYSQNFGGAVYSGSDYYTDKLEQLVAGRTWFKLGLLNWADMEFMVGGYTRRTYAFRDAYSQTSPQLTIVPCANGVPACVATVQQTYVFSYDRTDRTSGMGDSELRFKLNLLGNDRGTFALAVMPYTTFPTGSNGIGQDAYRAGVIVPFEINIFRHIRFNLQAEATHAFFPTYNYYGIGGGLGVNPSYSELLGAGRVTYHRWEELQFYAEASGGGYVGNNRQSPYATLGGGVESKLLPGLILFAHGDARVTHANVDFSFQARPDFNTQLGIAVRY